MCHNRPVAQTYDNRSDDDLIKLHDRFHLSDFTTDDAAAIAVHHGLTAEMVRRGLDHGHYADGWGRAVVEGERRTINVRDIVQRSGDSTGLPLSLLAAIRQAAADGASLMDLVSMLTVNGWQVMLVPMDDESEDESEDEGEGEGDDESEDMMPEDDMSPEVDPEDDMEEGLYRRIMARLREAFGMTKESVQVGSFVRWQSSGGTAQGRVEHVMTEGVLGVPESSFSIRAEPGDPAVLIRVWRRTANGWEETETLVGHKASTLRLIDSLAKADNYDPPQGAQEAAQRALRWIGEGKAGDGFTDVGRARAAQLARGDAVSEDTIRRMSAYFSRHTPDTKAEGFNSGEKGFPSPGRVAWDAWGGDAGKRWADSMVARLNKSTTTTTGGDVSVTITVPVDKAAPHAYEPSESGMACSVCRQAEDHWAHKVRRGAAHTMKSVGEARFTLGPWYIPNMEDAHGEWTDAAELQAALWEYVRCGDRRIRLQHNVDVVAGEWVEAMTWPYEVTVPMMLPDGASRDMTFPKDTVFLGVQWEPWAWELVKTGRVLGYSIGGSADRLLVDLPEESAA